MGRRAQRRTGQVRLARAVGGFGDQAEHHEGVAQSLRDRREPGEDPGDGQR